MNWKTFKKELEKTEKVVFIDMLKTKRGFNDVRILRFFFCGRDNIRILEQKYKAIGFYVVIEKNYSWKDYDLWINLIDEKQNQGKRILSLYNLRHITEGYVQAIKRINALLSNGKREEGSRKPSKAFFLKNEKRETNKKIQGNSKKI